MYFDDILPFDKSKDAALSRRGFGALSLGAGVAAAGSARADTTVNERDVTITTADGVCDAALFTPEGAGPWPGVVVFTDILGLRPAFRQMGRRLCAEGYVVVVPNPFYRTKPAPILSPPFDFSKPEDRAKLTPFTTPLTTDAKTRDAAAYVAYLDGLKSVNHKAKIGVCGYCMGGPYTMIAAAVAPARVGALGSFHGGGLVTDKPDSPHLLVPKITAHAYFGVAGNDDQRQPEAKTVLKNAFDGANNPAKIEVYSTCQHGWCVPDGAVYNKAEADRAYGELVALYRRALV